MKKIISLTIITLSSTLFLLSSILTHKSSSADTVSQHLSETQSTTGSSELTLQSQTDSFVEDAWVLGNPTLDQAVKEIDSSELGQKIAAISNPTVKDLMYYFFASGEDPRVSDSLEGDFFSGRFVIIGDTPKGEFPPLGASLPGYEGVVTTGIRDGEEQAFSTTDLAQSTDKAEVIATWLALQN